METAPASPLPPALREAEHWGWLLYADRQAAKSGRLEEVYERVAARSRRRQRSQVLGWFGFALMVLNSALVLGNPTHGLISLITGWAGLLMSATYGLVVMPWCARSMRRLTLRLEHERAGLAGRAA